MSDTIFHIIFAFGCKGFLLDKVFAVAGGVNRCITHCASVKEFHTVKIFFLCQIKNNGDPVIGLPTDDPVVEGGFHPIDIAGTIGGAAVKEFAAAELGRHFFCRSIRSGCASVRSLWRNLFVGSVISQKVLKKDVVAAQTSAGNDFFGGNQLFGEAEAPDVVIGFYLQTLDQFFTVLLPRFLRNKFPLGKVYAENDNFTFAQSTFDCRGFAVSINEERFCSGGYCQIKTDRAVQLQNFAAVPDHPVAGAFDRICQTGEQCTLKLIGSGIKAECFAIQNDQCSAIFRIIGKFFQ